MIDLINECFLVCQELGELSRSGRILDQISFNTAKPRFKSCLSSHANLLYKITWTWPTSAVILHSHSSTHTHTHQRGISVGLRRYTIPPPNFGNSFRSTFHEENTLSRPFKRCKSRAYFCFNAPLLVHLFYFGKLGAS